MSSATPHHHHLLLFGDQTDNVGASIRHLYAASSGSSSSSSRPGGSGLLAKFLRDATDVCQIAFGNLHPRFRDDDQDGTATAAAAADFESLLELSDQHDETDGSPVLVSCTLSYFARLGELILRAEEDPTLLTSPRTIIGLCISIFPAALAATASSALELARLSIETFPAYFAMALASHARAKNIEWGHGTWSYLFPGQTEDSMEALLAAFHQESAIPKHKKTWVGVVGYNWVTVSGPPTVLERMLATPAFAGLERMALPVAGAVHAPHLAAPDLKSVVELSSPIWNLPLRAEAALMSHNGVPYNNNSNNSNIKGLTLGHVAQRLFTSVMQEQLRLQQIFENTAKLIRDSRKSCSSASSQVTPLLSVIGPSAQKGRLIRTLRDAGLKSVESPVPGLGPDATALDSMPALRGGSGAIAIVGMSARFPCAEDLTEFWKLLMDGRTTHKMIPQDRFNVLAFYDPTGEKKNTIMNTDGCFLDHPGAFDTKLFQMSPREAMLVDPTHRLLLMVTQEALEKAGYASYSAPDTRDPSLYRPPTNKRTAVYFGQNSDAWREVNAQQGIDAHTASGLLRAFSPGRVNHHFGFDGGSYSIDTACSSSATAIQLACTALLNRECDMALAGGAQIANSPFEFSALGQSGFLSSGGGCRTFRADADGYCRGEAVGVVVLKRLEDAVADNDNVVALVTGWGRNYSAKSRYMTAPHPPTQERLVRRVLRQANARPEDVGYVELHGTGTKVGDAAEMELVTKVFGKDRDPNHPIHVGSLKANIGHSESAAGVSSVIKAALMLAKGTIPPQAMITADTELHPAFKKLHMDAIRIDTRPKLFAGSNEKKKKKSILVNSFDAAGGNTCLLLEEAPPRVPQQQQSLKNRDWHIVTVSAATAVSRERSKAKLLEYLEENPDAELGDIAYTTTARRTQYRWRSHYVVPSRERLEQELKESTSTSAVVPTDGNSYSNNSSSSNPEDHDVPAGDVNGNPPGIVYAFSGQGSQDFGPAGVLYRTHPVFRAHLDALDDICQECIADDGNVKIDSITRVILDPAEAEAAVGPYHTVETHLALVCIQLALAELWKSWSVKPALVVGHSLGEYAALCIAGVLSVHDALWLVAQRALLLTTLPSDRKFGMVSLMASADTVTDLLGSQPRFRDCSIACYNGPEAHVVGGPRDELSALVAEAAALGIACKETDIRFAYHTKHMASIRQPLEALANKVAFQPPKIKVVSTVTGAVVSDAGVFDAAYMARHIVDPTRFQDAVEAVRGECPAPHKLLWLELGLGTACLSMIKMTLDTPMRQLLASFHSPHTSCWETMTRSLGKAYQSGCVVDWAQFHKPFEPSLKLLELPTYQFDTLQYWQPYTADTAAAMGVEMGLRRGEGPASFMPTSTVQRIRCQNVTADEIEVIFTSSLAHPALCAAIRDHRIGEFSVCPASLFVNMALTAATYVYNRFMAQKDDQKLSLREVRDMKLEEPFVLSDEPESQEISIIVTADEGMESETLGIRFESRIGSGRREYIGVCKVVLDAKRRLGQERSTEEVQQERYDVIDARNARAAMDQIVRCDNLSYLRRETDRIGHQLFYRIFSSNAIRYGPRYRGVSVAYVPEQAAEDGVQEAVAKVTPVAAPADEIDTFASLNPYHGEALVHIGGFLANMNLKEDEDALYFAIRVQRIKMFADVDPNHSYMSYTHMFTPDVRRGNCIVVHVHIWKDELLVGFAHMCFSRMKKAALLNLLGGIRARYSNSNNIINNKSTPATNTTPSSSMAGPLNSVEKPEPEPEPCLLLAESMADVIISAIISETGVELQDVDNTTRLSELGVDSLMGIAILRKVKAETGRTIEMAVFQQLQTIQDIRDRFGGLDGSNQENVGNNDEATKAQADKGGRGRGRGRGWGEKNKNKIIVPNPTNDDYKTPWARSPFDTNLTIVPAHLTSNAVLLHAGPENHHHHHHHPAAVTTTTPDDKTVRPFFLVAGSTGSAAVYAQLVPALNLNLMMKTNRNTTTTPTAPTTTSPTGRPIWVLESPFLEHPASMIYTPEEIAPLYVAAMKKIQPKGPYLLGGYSAGGVHAYEMARLLLEEENGKGQEKGKQVEKLVIVDMKAHLPGETYDREPTMEDVRSSLNNNAIFANRGGGEGKEKEGGGEGRRKNDGPVEIPAEQLETERLFASLKCMYNWRPTPMSPDRQPTKGTVIIWARSGPLQQSHHHHHHHNQPQTEPEEEKAEEDANNNPLAAENRDHELWFRGSRHEGHLVGANGWDVLVGPDVETHVVDGDHWSILEMPYAEKLVDLIHRVVTN